MDRFIPLKSASWDRLVSGLAAILPLAILLLAAILRFHLLGAQSYWNDEGNTLRLVERPIPELIAAASRDIHPPGYYLLLKAWWTLIGETEFALRAFSALAGVLTVACIYGLGRKLSARGAGSVAALLVAINTFNIYYSQEARMYALLGLIAAAAMLAFVQFMLTSLPVFSRKRLYIGVALAILNAVGLYTQYVYPFVMITQGVLFVLWWVRDFLKDPHPQPLSLRARGANAARLVQYVGVNLLTLLLFLPQLNTALRQVTAWPRTGAPVDAGTGLATVARWLVYGSTSDLTIWWAYLWPVIFVLAGLFPDWRSQQSGWWRRLMPLIWLLITVAPLFALGLFREANLKFLIPAQLALALLIGRGIWLLWEIGSANLNMLIDALPRVLAVGGLLSILSFSWEGVLPLYHDPRFARDDYRAIARRIELLPGAVILNAPNQQEAFSYYYKGETFPIPAGLGGDDAKTQRDVLDVIRRYRRIYVVYWGEGERDPNRVVEKTLAANAFEVGFAWFEDVRVVQYATLPPEPQADSITVKPAAQFGDTITLTQATLTTSSVQLGEVVGVTLTWQTTQPITTRYKVFVQLLNSAGQVVSQHDSEPSNYLAPTTTWQPNIPVTDSHGILIPLNVQAGEHTLIVGLYDANDPKKRLKVNEGDYLELGKIRVIVSTVKP